MPAERIQAIQKHLSAHEGLLITGSANRFYFTGFPSSAGILLITGEQADFLIDFRYYEKAKSVATGCRVHLANDADRQLAELAERYAVQTLYLETDAASISSLVHFGAVLPDVSISMEDRFTRIIEAQRQIKTPEELRCIEAAQKITDDTFLYILDRIHPGRTELEIMLDMEFFLRRQGSEGVSFDFIVVSGKNSSLPHGVPTEKKVERGNFLTMDFGAVVGGYHSDMTRTVAIGSAGERQRFVYQTVLEAQQMALEAIRPGLTGSEIDAVARDHIYAKGFEGCFGHGLGHSVGIEIHENPRFSPACGDSIKPGMIMTVEPGIYLENEFGVRIEDMVLITEDGCRNLTASKKELIIL